MNIELALVKLAIVLQGDYRHQCRFYVFDNKFLYAEHMNMRLLYSEEHERWLFAERIKFE